MSPGAKYMAAAGVLAAVTVTFVGYFTWLENRPHVPKPLPVAAKTAPVTPARDETPPPSVQMPAPKPVEPQPQTSAKGGTVSGRVDDEEDRPVAGALVRLERLSESDSFIPSGRPIESRETHTDSAGLFRMDDVTPELSRISAQAGDRAIARSCFGGDRVIEWVVLYLEPAYTVKGRVVDEANQPVAAAWVEAFEDYLWFRRIGASTDADGSFAVPILEYKKYCFFVEADGFAHLRTDCVGPDAGNVTFVLRKGYPLAGRLVQADTGAVVPKIKLCAFDKDAPDDMLVQYTDAEGHFRFENLPQGRRTLDVDDNLLVLAETPPDIVIDAATPVPEVALKVTQGGSICGQVLDVQTDAPIASASVGASRNSADRLRRYLYRHVDTDAGGHFCIEGLPAGEYSVSTSLHDSCGSYFEHVSIKVALVPGQEKNGVEFRLKPSAVVQGIVVDRNGKAVPHAWLDAKTGPNNQMAYTHSGEDGRFCLHVPLNAPVTITAYESWRQAETSLGPLGPEGQGDVRLVLGDPATGVLGGVVLDTQGTRLPNIGVILDDDATKNTGRNVGQTATGPDGRFVLRHLPAGRYRLSLQLPRSRSPLSHGTEVYPLADGQRRLDLRIEVDMSEAHAISGRVTNEDGEPCNRVDVNASGGSDWHNTRTDDDGRYAFYSLVESAYRIRVRNGRFLHLDREGVAPGTRNVDFRIESEKLRPKATVRGRVVDAATRQPVTVFDVAWTCGAIQDLESAGGAGGVGSFESHQDAEGRFELTDVEPPAVKICAKTAELSRACLVRPVAPNQVLDDIVLELVQGSHIEGIVRSQAGEPVPNAIVYNYNDLPSGPPVSTDVSGRFRIDNVPESLTEVNIECPGYVSGSFLVPSAQDGVRFVDVTLTKPRSVTSTIFSFLFGQMM